MILAIADTGVNCTHEDLSSGCMAGWNFYDNNNDTTDVYGHGTAVAGVAAALGNNNIGVAGNAWQSKIMPLRVSAPDGTATYSAIASAITYAADGGAKVVNVSYQVGGSSTVQSAAKYLKGKGGLLVVSEGNYASDTGNTNSPDIISVSAVDASDVLYSWSSFGSDVDVSAPGCTGATTKADGGYGSFCGTSNSAPEVSGLLMLIWSVNPALTPDQVQNVLFNSTKDLGSVGWDKYYGWGRIDAEVAISMAVSNINPNPNPEPNPLPPPTIDTIPPVVDVTSPVDGSSVVKMEVYVDELLVLKINSKSSISYKWNTRKSSSGAHVINVKAYDETGNVGQSSVTVYK
jgi:subtilisin family serine protease